MSTPSSHNRLYTQTLLMASGAGLSSALVFASILTQSPLAIFLLTLSPLPILMAGLGWTPYAATFAVAIAGVVLSLLSVSSVVYAYVLMVALPSVLLSAVTTLHIHTVWRRRDSESGREDIQQQSWWLSTGALLMVCVVLAGIMTLFGALRIGGYDAYMTFLREVSEAFVRFRLQIKEQEPIVIPGDVNTDDVLRTMVALIPLFLGMVMLLYLGFNLWVSARLVAMSQRLPRPWPQMIQLRLPREMAFGMIICGLLALMPSYAGLLGKSLIGAMVAAFAVQGAVAIHVMTLGLSMRALILGSFYLTLFLMPWVVLFVALYGFIDAFVRKPAQSSSNPPSSPSPPTQFS